MKPYESYKKTNIPWLEEVPSHWDIGRAKNLYKKENRTPLENDEVVTCFRDGQVTLRKNRRTTGFTESIKEHGYQHIEKGDLVIHVMDAFAGAVGVSDSNGKGTPVYSVCTSKMDINNYYYAHIVKEMASSGFIQSLYRGIRERSSDFRFEVFAAQTLPIPPRTEQDQIVRYLDWQISKINKLVQTKKRQIELLKEQKQAVINKAVTKGLDDSVPMKDSGVEWLGEVPVGWDIIRCKYIFKERNERSTTGNEKHLSMSQKLGLIPVEKLNERRMLSESYIGGKIAYENDLVLNRLKAHLGVFSISNYHGVISPDYTVLKVNRNKILPILAEFLLKCQPCRKELRIRVRGVVEGFWRLYTDDFNTISLPVPPLEEQQAIVDYIADMTGKIDTVIKETEREIELLSEYKTSLISSVVIGKVDVRDVVVPEFETTEEVAKELEKVEIETEG